MNCLKNSLLFLLLFFFNFNNISCQVYTKGFVFNYNGDTVKGYITLPEKNRPAPECIFKPKLNENIAFLKPSEVAGFGTSKILYAATKFHWSHSDTVMFTRLLFDGQYDLKYFELPGNKYFIIERPDSSSYTIRYPPELTPGDIFSGVDAEKKFKLQADSIFPGVHDLKEYNSGIKPEIYSFVNLFRQYHNTIRSADDMKLFIVPETFKAGYIVNNENETIDGLIGNQLQMTNFSTCIFRSAKNENAIRFMPSDIKAFGSKQENKVFVSTHIFGEKDSSVFVRLLFDGSIDLLYYKSSGIDHFLLKDSQGGISELVYPPVLSKKDYLAGLSSAKKFRIQADTMFSTLGINSTPKPDLRSIFNSLKKYHKINGLEYKAFYHSGWEFNLGAVGGVKILNYIPPGNFNELKAFSDPAPHLGVYLSMTNIKYGLGIFMRNTTGYHKDNYSYRLKSGPFNLYHQTTIKSVVNDLQAGIRISYPDKFLLNPFAEAGPVITYYINPEYENYDSRVYNEVNAVLSSYDRNEINSSRFFGYLVRAGFDINFGSRSAIRISGEYDHLKGGDREIIKSGDLSLTYILRFR